MILYNSNYFGLPQLTTVSGSAVYRTILPSLLSTCIVLVYKFSIGHGESAQEIRADFHQAKFCVHPFVITIYIMSFSLIINHRLNYCYQRYWEACSNIFMMSSKWIDSATTLAAFHYQSTVYEKDRPRSFGDEDKPFDQFKDKDKNKSAPTGGNTRTAMVNPGGVNPVDVYVGDDKLKNVGDSASFLFDTSDADSSSSIFVPCLSAAVEFSTNHGSATNHQSFVSIRSRERHRRYSEAENLSRAEKLFSSSRDNSCSKVRAKTRPNVFRQLLFSKRIRETKYQNERNISDLNAVESPSIENSTRELNNDSSIIDAELTDSVLKSNRSSTPSQDNLSTSMTGVPRRGLFHKFPSVSRIQSRTRGEAGETSGKMSFADVVKRGNSSSRMSFSKSFGGHGINKAYNDRFADMHPTEGHHRRFPSTDIPRPGIGGSIVKSFKPNPSLDWQKRNMTAMPRNTGLHSTVFEAPIGFDLEKLLLTEDSERREESREKDFEDRKQRQQEFRQEVQTGIAGEFFNVARRASFNRNTNFGRTPSAPLFSNTNSVIKARNFTRSTSDIRTSSKSTLSQSTSGSHRTKDIQKSNKLVDSTRLPNLSPRLELYDLPSLHKKHTPGNSEINAMDTNGSERQSSSLRPPVEKMNGRASLFLQEAAHLYSLMSAIAMSSLRMDMEGVSSPLVDYVPGQKFPPVNPDEMQIKVLITEDKVQQDAKKSPHDDSDNGESGPQSDATKSELGSENPCTRENSHTLRIMRNNKYSNLLMHMFGMSRNSRQRTIYNASRPFQVLGGISDAEVEMLRKVRGVSAQHALCCLWLREFVTREHLDGSTGGVGPPIVARVYQYISEGTQQFNNCRKTAFTDFPFPHAQLTSFFGFVSMFVFPLLYYTYVNNIYLALALNFFTMSCFIGIQEVSLELEEPFIRYPNDLPLNNYQAQFNEALISSLYGGFHPDAWGDAVDNDGISAQARKAMTTIAM